VKRGNIQFLKNLNIYWDSTTVKILEKRAIKKVNGDRSIRVMIKSRMGVPIARKVLPQNLLLLLIKLEKKAFIVMRGLLGLVLLEERSAQPKLSSVLCKWSPYGCNHN